jgi:hypothetical protein
MMLLFLNEYPAACNLEFNTGILTYQRDEIPQVFRIKDIMADLISANLQNYFSFHGMLLQHNSQLIL